jgi:hypothetical protein
VFTIAGNVAAPGHGSVAAPGHGSVAKVGDDE